MDKIVCKQEIRVGNRTIHKGQILYKGIDYNYGYVGYWTKKAGDGGKKMLTMREFDVYKQYFHEKN